MDIGLMEGAAIAVVALAVIGLLVRARSPQNDDLAGPPGNLGGRAQNLGGALQQRGSTKAPVPASPSKGSRSASEPEAVLGNLPPQARAAIEQALVSGNKIEAIRLLREATRLKLRDAKELVERLLGQSG
ncbi:MAG TPA: hypothetical protein PKD92_05005 [Novosphingobium sp.]|nr:hypothetical protein [Novosphingobium sp.]HMP55916.1 hypothetical protein [Novosphingobium sp.]